jgi:hypothetical protein
MIALTFENFVYSMLHIHIWQWLVEHVAAQLTPEEVRLRRQQGKVSGLVEDARRDAEEWARQVVCVCACVRACMHVRVRV